MRLPGIPTRPEARVVWANLTFDVIAALGVGVTMALVTALLPSIARKAGFDPLALAALAAAPFLANLLGGFAGRVGPRSPGHLSLLRGAGAALLVVLVLEPPPIVIILASTAYWLSLSFGSPLQLRLWGAMYPSRLRGRVVGAMGTSRAGAGAIAVIVAGVAADRFGGPVVLAVGALVGVGCAMAYAGFRVPSAAPNPSFSVRDAIGSLRERPFLARIVLAQAFYGGGLIAAAPLYALIYVDRLDLSLASIGLVGILVSGATMGSFYAWGAVADRTGAVLVLRLGSMAGLASLVLFATAPSVVVLLPAAVLAGIGGAAIDLGISTAISEQTPMSARAAAMAGWNALTGARGLVAPFIAAALVQGSFVDVTTAMLGCALVSAVGVVLYLTARPKPAGSSREAAADAPAPGLAIADPA
jgi:MFS family permease